MALGRYGRQITGAQNQIRKNSQNLQRYQWNRGAEDINRNAYSAGESAKADANERGVMDSSIPMAQSDKIEAERARRYDALNKQRSTTEENWAQEDMIRSLTKSMAGLQKMQGLFNSFIQGGASGAAATYTGTPQG
jgi:hypothetical protein